MYIFLRTFTIQSFCSSPHYVGNRGAITPNEPLVAVVISPEEEALSSTKLSQDQFPEVTSSQNLRVAASASSSVRLPIPSSSSEAITSVDLHKNSYV